MTTLANNNTMAYHNPRVQVGPPYFMTDEQLQRCHVELMLRGQGDFCMGVAMDQIDPEILDLSYQQQQQAARASVDYQQSLQTAEHQQQPLQRYMNESAQMGPLRASNLYQHSVAAPITAHPHRATRMPSPTPSLHSYGPTNTSSAHSPGAESDLVYEGSPSASFTSKAGMMNFPPWLHDSHHYLPDLSIGVEYSGSQQYSLPNPQNSFGCVNMSQVQSFADPQQEFGYDDEGYAAIALHSHSNDYIEVDHQKMKSDGGAAPYRYAEDEGFGGSAIDAASVHNTVASPVTNYEGNDDAEADVDDPENVPSPASDTDYNPKSTRTRKRPAPSSREPELTSSRSAKRARPSRATKPTNNSITLTTNAGTHQCKFCPQSCKDENLLARHILKEHTKAFQCMFAFAGCNAVFSTKNEWKRHVSSQHMNLQTWVCLLDSCGQPHPAPKSSTSQTRNSRTIKPNVVGGEFNRKDLFTQHLKRMHVPEAAKRKGPHQHVAADAWEAQIKNLQTTCLRQNRTPPSRLQCPLQDCAVTFNGKNCWDDRMEHVGKHLEKLAAEASKTGIVANLDQGADRFLIEWALENEIVVTDEKGGYKFPGAADAAGAGEEDADGEDEE